LTNIFKDPLNFLKFIKILFGLLILIIGMRLGYKRYNWGALFIIIFSALLILLFCVQSCIFENRNMIAQTASIYNFEIKQDINELIESRDVTVETASTYRVEIKRDINEFFMLEDTKLQGGYRWHLEV